MLTPANPQPTDQADGHAPVKDTPVLNLRNALQILVLAGPNWVSPTEAFAVRERIEASLRQLLNEDDALPVDAGVGRDPEADMRNPAPLPADEPCSGSCYSEFEEGRACRRHGRPVPGTHSENDVGDGGVAENYYSSERMDAARRIGH